MTSPFDAFVSKSVVMYLEPVRNEYWKTYQNIITLSDMPAGPIREMVKAMNPPKLSPFKSFGPFAAPLYGHRPGAGCTYALMRYPNGGAKSTDAFMLAEDIPAVFAYLRSNGYDIDTQTLHYLASSNVHVGGVSETRMSGNRKPVCMFTYSGK